MKWILLLLPLGQGAFADYNSAVHDYERKAFDRAFIEFRRLAELGDTDSQRNLAAMYARGEAVGKDMVEAYSWASLAAKQDPADAEQLRQAIEKKLTADGLAVAQARAKSLHSQFSPEALQQRLLPKASDRKPDCSVDVNSDATVLTAPPPRYPIDGLRYGEDAVVKVRFYLNAAGAPVRIKIVDTGLGIDGGQSSKTQKDFRKAVLDVLPNWSFAPPVSVALMEIPREITFTFTIIDDEPDELVMLASSLQQKSAALEKASAELLNQTAELIRNSGGPMHATGERINRAVGGKQVRLDPSSHEMLKRRLNMVADDLSRRSALLGDGDGQYRLARQLLTGERCEKDDQKGLMWLTLAAQQGQADAQFLLALRFEHGTGVTSDSSKAIHWLKAAVDSGHEHARLRYALHLMRQQPAQVAEAEKLLPITPYEDDIAWREVKALQSAAIGNRDEAIQHQQRVIEIAKELDLPLTERQQFLYQLQQLAE